jgi:hypothetical protein
MKIAIMSDCHDNWQNLETAIKIANTQKCEFLLFAGDLISPPGVALLEKFNGKVKFIWGNNENEKMGLTRKMDKSKNMELFGDFFEGEIEGVKIFMIHTPRLAEIAAKSGLFDICIYGHDHTARNENIGKSILLNPGEIHGYKTGKPSFAILDTKGMKIEFVSISE